VVTLGLLHPYSLMRNLERGGGNRQPKGCPDVKIYRLWSFSEGRGGEGLTAWKESLSGEGRDLSHGSRF